MQIEQDTRTRRSVEIPKQHAVAMRGVKSSRMLGRPHVFKESIAGREGTVTRRAHKRLCDSLHASTPLSPVFPDLIVCGMRARSEPFFANVVGVARVARIAFGRRWRSEPVFVVLVFWMHFMPLPPPLRFKLAATSPRVVQFLEIGLPIEQGSDFLSRLGAGDALEKGAPRDTDFRKKVIVKVLHVLHKDSVKTLMTMAMAMAKI
jgi:hypothetical protein